MCHNRSISIMQKYEISQSEEEDRSWEWGLQTVNHKKLT